MTHLVFDIDGTLADTEPIHRRAYRLAGAEMPDDAFGKPWSSWLPEKVGESDARRIHRVKNEIVVKTILDEGVTPLPAARALVHFKRQGHSIGTMTASAQDVARVTIRALGLQNIVPVMFGAPPDQRAEFLMKLARFGIYVDDLQSSCTRAMLIGWAGIPIRPETTYESLVDAIRGAIDVGPLRPAQAR